MYFSFRPSSTHREPEVTVNNSVSLDYMHADDHIPITCNNYPKCKKKNTKETKPISYMHYSKKKTKKQSTGFIPLIPSYRTKKNFATKEKVCIL